MASRRSAAAALLVAATSCLHHDVHRIGPLGEASPPRNGALRVLVFGDFGYPTIPQHLTARAIRFESEARPFDLALQVGDNLYKCGPDALGAAAEACRFSADGATLDPGTPSPDDPLFLVNEAPLEGLVARGGGPLPIYLALGNHDVAAAGGCAVPGLDANETGRRRACLSVARRTPTWAMPGRHYVLERGPVRIVVLDTNVVVADYGGFTLEEEIAFLREATAACSPGGLQCFVVGHHPPAVVHGFGRGRPAPWAARMARLAGAAGGRARAFFAGHVHALEHLTLGPLEVFVSGSTAMGAFGGFRYRWPASAQPRFATSAWGYAVLEADAEGYRIRFADVQGEPLHCCEAGPAGPCRPVAC